ncbi:MAG: hypothetical protein HYS57_01970, partial [Parcubacteria group bacterium]|nr:hypothetical protein [Parcubacteria group bacterium]
MRLLPLIIVLVFLILIGFGVPQPLFATSSNVNVFATVPVLRCGDGVDNDGDGKTDYPNDPGCDATGDNDETDSAQATTDFYEQGVKPIIVFPRWAFVGATTTYEVEFPVDVAIPQEGKIVLAYPLGFSFTSLCATALSVPENNDLNGFAPGTVTIATLVCNGSLRTVTLTTAG